MIKEMHEALMRKSANYYLKDYAVLAAITTSKIHTECYYAQIDAIRNRQS